MGIQKTLRSWLGIKEKYLYYHTGDNFQPVLQLPSEAGVNTSPQESQNIDAVFACVRAISEPIGSVQRKVVKRQGETISIQPKHQVSRLLTEYPNSYQTSNSYFERALYHMTLWGDHFAYIFRDADGTPVSLRIIHPSLVSDYRFDQETNIMWWRVDPGDTYRDPFIPTGWIPHFDMIHVPILNNGIRGRSVITAYRNDYGQAIATRKFGNEFFNKNGTPSIWVETTEQQITPEQNQAFAEQMRKNRHGNMMVPWGRKVNQLSIPPEQAQFIASRMFNVETIARIFNVPPPIIGHFKDGANYSNLETLTRNYATVTLMPYTSKIEAEYTWKLFTEAERFRGYRLAWDFSDLLKADPKTRADVASKYIQNAVRTPNEIRAIDGLEPMAGGDELYLQQNMAPLSGLENLLMSKHGNSNGQQNDNGQSASDGGSGTVAEGTQEST